MSPDVIFEVSFVSESLPAYLALKGCFSRVHSHVYIQVSLFCEGSVADCARKSMDMQVAFHYVTLVVFSACKNLPTDLTREVPISSSLPYFHLHLNVHAVNHALIGLILDGML